MCGDEICTVGEILNEYPGRKCRLKKSLCEQHDNDMSEVQYKNVDWLAMSRGNGPMADLCEQGSKPFPKCQESPTL